MTKVVSPSEMKPITPGQVGKFYDVFVATLCKSGLPSEPTQQVLESQGGALADEFVASVRRRVEVVSSMIVRRVKVNRIRTPQEMLDATGRKQYVTDTVVAGMPRGKGSKATVYFFKPDKSVYDENGLISDDEVERQYELRSLKPDPYAQGAVNEADPAFADGHPNGAHWKDADGKWCYTAFDQWDGGERFVRVYRYDRVWYDYWWFAGVRK